MYKISHFILYFSSFLLYLSSVKSLDSPLPLSSTQGFHRKLQLCASKCDIGTGCQLPSGSSLNLIHIKAVGLNDTIHYIWSTYNIPTVIVALTSHEAALEIDWEKLVKLQSGGLWFTENPVQSAALILTQLWQYDDSKDVVAIPDNENKTINVNITDFIWSGVNISQTDDAITAFATATSNDTVFSNNGKFGIEFSVSGLSEAAKKYPHLLFNGNSTQMRLNLNNLNTMNEKYRFAAEFMTVSGSTLNKSWHHTVSDSIDDEYSPGVFKIHHLYSPYDHTEPEKSFLMWKPVAYLGEKATVANSSDATTSKLVYSIDIPTSLISILNNGTNVTHVSWNMTFGTSGDGWYRHTKYSSWSVMIGLGDPMSEDLSLLAKIVIGVGLGTPCAIILGGGIFLLYKKLRKDDDDELLLAQ